MLEIKRPAIGLDESELLELERIITDGDEKEALRFLRKRVYDKVAQSQRHCEVYHARNQKDSYRS
ncbi:MAG: hypothetical protein ACETVS_00120 [Dehalococcoidales bacterium]